MSRFHVSTFLRPLAPSRFRGFTATMDALTSARFSLSRTDLPDSHSEPSNHSVLNHTTCLRHRFNTLPLTVADVSTLLFFFVELRLRHWGVGSSTCHAESGSYPTDWLFASSCFPPCLTATQLLSATGPESVCPGEDFHLSGSVCFQAHPPVSLSHRSKSSRS